MSEEKIHCCVDRILRIDELAQRNIGKISDVEAGSADDRSRARMAVLKDATWETGKVLKVGFLDGQVQVQDRVKQAANMWLEHVNLELDWIANPSDADIRISFEEEGSWSYLGNRASMIHKSKPTMNYGWLEPSLSDEQYHRVVLHEFGHAFAAIHEHQNPGGTIPWDEAAVLSYYMGPPNDWSEDQVRFNVLDAYNAEQTNHTNFDDQSIMLYPIPAQHLTDTTKAVDWRNSSLSALDIEMMGALYPGRGADRVIGVGENVTATIIVGGESDRYVFDVADTSAGLYQIETTGQTDVVMSLFGPDVLDDFITADDDTGEGANARIRAQLGPGRYLVVVNHFTDRGTGDYSLRVDRLA